jgi:hypothetical protein
MIYYSYQIWTFKFSVSELREMIKGASGDDLKILESVFDEVKEFDDDELIWADFGDECRIYSRDGDLGTDTEDLLGFLQTQDFDNGDMWS